MRKFISISVIICIILVGCSDKKAQINDNTQTALEGMWKLKSGIWDNEDGTFLRFPEDSITEGPAYIIYSKTHYMVIANAPKMDYFRGELVGYSIEENKLKVSTKVSNIKTHEGMEAVWTFKVEKDILTAELGGNKEVWERVE